MFYNVKALKGFKLGGIDGEIGKVRDLYFDDRHWTVRYLVADTGAWLTRRQVLISPYALGSIEKEAKTIEISLTREQIENSPPLDSDKPVSRQFEDDYYAHFGWPTYWGGPNPWGNQPYLVRDREKWGTVSKGEKAWDPNLRSTQAVDGYHIQATDGELGHVEDFIVDDESWTIRYLVVGTLNWWPGKKVLISPHWIDRVSWSESKVFVKLSRESVRLSPEFTEEFLVTRDYEERLHRHYDRHGYWVG